MSSQNPNQAPPSSGTSSLLFTGLYGAGMAAMFIGERIIGGGGGGKARTVLTATGFALVLAMVTLRLLRARKDEGDRAGIEWTIAGLQALGIGAVLLYVLQSDLAVGLLGKPLERDYPKLAVALQVAWPSLWLLSALPLALVEMSYASMVRAPRLEVGRVRDAMLSGFGLAGALVFCGAISYVGAQRDKKADLSYFRTTRPGEATHKLVASLDKPITVAYFFPPANEVREEVKNYFDDLANDSKNLEVKSYDHALDPAKAKELGVSGNGVIVIAKAGRHEQLSVGVDLEAARGQLRSLDKEVQKRLIQVARTSKSVYLTTGHGERSADPVNDTDKRATIRELRGLLMDQGYTPRDLGAAEGLGADVPADAGTVLMIGPTKPLLPEESASLVRYVARGGHLFVALDPEAGLDMKDLLGPLGLAFRPVALASDQAYLRKNFQPSDRGNIATAAYSSHPTVTGLSRARLPLVFMGAGSLEQVSPKPAGTSIDFTVHSLPSTWNDVNGNFEFDTPTETRKTWELVAAVTRKSDAKPPEPAKDKDGKDIKPATPPNEDGRVLVLADSDAITDAAIRLPGNPYLLVDGMKWLLGDDAIIGETNSEQDVPIAHTRNQDVVWFYSTIFLAPALVLGVGLLVTRRRGRARRKGGGGSETNPTQSREASL